MDETVDEAMDETVDEEDAGREIDLECPAGEVVVIRTTNPTPICVDGGTANKWVGYGMATIVAGTSSDGADEEAMDETVDEDADNEDIDKQQ